MVPAIAGVGLAWRLVVVLLVGMVLSTSFSVVFALRSTHSGSLSHSVYHAMSTSSCSSSRSFRSGYRRMSFMSLNTATTPYNNAIKHISVKEFGEVLSGVRRKDFQIVDVREPVELLESALHGDDIINLPMSSMNEWSSRVLRGELLDREKAIVCMCKLGGRSLKASTFFATEAGFREVLNVVGGISAYALEVDSSVNKIIP